MRLGRAAAGYLLLFVLLTFPLCLHPTNRIVSNNGDGFFDMLLFWYARHGNLGFVQTLFYPQGTTLGSDQGFWLIPFLSVPLQWIMPLPMVFNVMSVGLFVASASAMYLLAIESGAGKAGAFAAGALLVLSPLYLDEMTQGILENMGLQWLLLFIWCGLRLRHGRGGLGTAVAGSLCLALAAMTSWYQAAFAGLFCLLYPPRQMAPVIAVALLLAAPLWFGQHQEMRTYDAGAARELAGGRAPSGYDPARFAQPLSEDDLRMDNTRQVLTDSADFSSLLARHRRGHLRDVLPGVLLLALATAGCWRLGRASAAWAALAAAFLLLSCGPYWMWSGKAVIPLPISWVPALVIPRPVRYLLAATVALCVLAAHAVPRIGCSRRAAVLVIGLVAMALAEVCLVQDAQYRIDLADTTVPAFYQRLAGQPEGALIELPLTPFTVQVGKQLYYQTVHHHAMLNYDFVRPQSMLALSRLAQQNGLLRFLGGGGEPVQAADVAALSVEGFRWVVWHRDFPQDASVYAILCQTLGQPRDEGDGVEVFELK